MENIFRMEEYDTYGIFLTTSGSRGDRLLFRYPFESKQEKSDKDKKTNANPYALVVEEDYKIPRRWNQTYLNNGIVTGFDNKVLASVLSPRKELCNTNFEVTIGDVLFCGYPMLLFGKETTSVKSFHISFALKCNTRQVIISQYQTLSRQLAIAIQHEQKRCSYMDQQKRCLQAMIDDMSSLGNEVAEESPFGKMLKFFSLPQELCSVFRSLKQTGTVQVYINKWTPISFCLPFKVYQQKLPSGVQFQADPDKLHESLCHLKPYHGLVLLSDEARLRAALPLDGSHALQRLLTVISPLKNIQQLAADADLAIAQVLKLVRHLVYWGHATIIYPLCETNVYVLSPYANTYNQARLQEKFSEQCSGLSLQEKLSDFSLPMTLNEHQDFLSLPQDQASLVQIVVWLLKHKLIMQLHTYVYLLRPPGVKARPKSIANHLSLHNVMAVIAARKSRNELAEREEQAADSVIPTSYSCRTLCTITSDSSINSDNTTEEEAFYAKKKKLLSGFPDELQTKIDVIPFSNSLEDLDLFIRLSQYFNGLYHVEEIMFKENMPRSDILTAIDKFRKVLITCMHEDAEITEKPI